MKPAKIAILIALTTVAQAEAATKQYVGPRTPLGFVGQFDNQKVFAEFCTGTAKSTEIPGVNYKNEKVSKAAQKLSKIAPLSFYFYSQTLKAYNLGSNKDLTVSIPAEAPNGTTPQAHAFLVQLCGEFRDRATMIDAKLGWVGNLFTLPNEDQKPIDLTLNVWSQFSAKSYNDYIRFSGSLWSAKAQIARAKPAGTVDGISIDAPVDGQTVCETQFVISEYVAKKIAFDGNLPNYLTAYKEFAKKCSAADLYDYYDFRGDSNFKPNSPESNAMIWHASSIGAHCTDRSKSDGKITDADCQFYYQYPFWSRWLAARNGLTTWLMHTKDHDQYFSDTRSMLTMKPLLGSPVGPLNYTLEKADAKSDLLDEFKNSIALYLTQPDIGLNSVSKLKTPEYDFSLVYKRLRDGVNRHTDWYASAYDDGLGVPKISQRTQAYSPFVASSYEMSKSNGFTAPGVTVSSPSDGRKHWMFIFRIKKNRWVNSASVFKGKPINFDLQWFDETSLGTVNLAKSEHAWDRMGTAIETELDSILYLHNLDTSGQVVGNE